MTEYREPYKHTRTVHSGIGKLVEKEHLINQKIPGHDLNESREKRRQETLKDYGVFA